METNSQCPVSGGIWSRPTIQPSSEASRATLQLMKQESRLSNFQRKEIKQRSKNRTDSSPTPPPSSQPVQIHRPHVSRKRSAESCRAGNSYAREKFFPSATRDLEKEKKELQDLLSMGTETPLAAPPQEGPAEKDSYEEVMDEIVERKQFLADMASLGQERDYVDIINSQISQKMQELELLEKQRAKRKGSDATEKREAPAASETV